MKTLSQIINQGSIDESKFIPFRKFSPKGLRAWLKDNKINKKSTKEEKDLWVIAIKIADERNIKEDEGSDVSKIEMTPKQQREYDRLSKDERFDYEYDYKEASDGSIIMKRDLGNSKAAYGKITRDGVWITIKAKKEDVQIDESLSWQMTAKTLTKLGFKELEKPTFKTTKGRVQHQFGIPMRAGKWADIFFVILDTDTKPYCIVDDEKETWYENLGDALKALDELAQHVNKLQDFVEGYHDDYVVRYTYFTGKDGFGSAASKEKSFKTLKQMAKWMETAEDKVPGFYEITGTSYPEKKKINESQLEEADITFNREQALKNIAADLDSEYKKDKQNKASINTIWTKLVDAAFKCFGITNIREQSLFKYNLGMAISHQVRKDVKNLDSFKLVTDVHKEKTWKLPEIEKDDELTEVLDPRADASVWIHDFVHSKNKRFKDKTKEERIEMALGAWYKVQGKSKKKSKKEDVTRDEIIDNSMIDEDTDYTKFENFQKQHKKMYPEATDEQIESAWKTYLKYFSKKS